MLQQYQQVPKDPHKALQILTNPTVLVGGSVVHHRPLLSLYLDGIIVSHLVGQGPWSSLKPAVLKCPRTGRSENCRAVRSSLLVSFPVGPPGPPDRYEHCQSVYCLLNSDG